MPFGAAQSAGQGCIAGVGNPRLSRVDDVHVQETAQAQAPAGARCESGRLQGHRGSHRCRGEQAEERQRDQLKAASPLAQVAGVWQRYEVLQTDNGMPASALRIGLWTSNYQPPTAAVRSVTGEH